MKHTSGSVDKRGVITGHWSVEGLSMQKAAILPVAEYNSSPCQNDLKCDFLFN